MKNDIFLRIQYVYYNNFKEWTKEHRKQNIYAHTYTCIKYNHMNEPSLLCDGDDYTHLFIDRGVHVDEWREKEGEDKGEREQRENCTYIFI